MSLIMADKITSSQFRLIYQELTWDKSVTDNKNCKEAEMSICNSCLNCWRGDHRRFKNEQWRAYKAIWCILECYWKKLNELQVTAVNDRCHTLSTEENEMLPTWLLLFPLKLFTSSVLPKLKHKKYNKNKHRLYRGSDFNSGTNVLITIRQWTTLVV